jgi:hypothetical protein
MTNEKMIENNEDIVEDVLDIRKLLREGKMSNGVARTLIMGSKVALSGMKLGLLAQQMGVDFEPVYYKDEKRKERKKQPH